MVQDRAVPVRYMESGGLRIENKVVRNECTVGLMVFRTKYIAAELDDIASSAAGDGRRGDRRTGAAHVRPRA